MQVDSATAAQVFDLWFHRSDVGVFQWFHGPSGRGGYAKLCSHQLPWESGRCPHRKAEVKCGQCSDFSPLPVTPQIVNLHLRGAVTLGAYQIGQDGTTVKWACLDFDDHGLCSGQELQDAALIARESLAALHIPTVFEASGGNGWRCHLWSFFASPITALKAKVVLDAALRQAELHDKPFIERFPKQGQALNGYGNLVKVPFGIHRKSRKRSQFLDGNLRPIVDTQQALATVEAVDPTVLDFVIDMMGLSIDDGPATAPIAPARNFSCSPEHLSRIVTHCWYFREVERQQTDPEHTLFYEDWWNYVLLCSRFGDVGANRILGMSQQDNRYNFEYTVNLINYIRAHGYHAPSCKRLRGGPGQIHCPLDPLHCGAPNAGGGTVQGVHFTDFEQREARRPERLIVQL